MRVPVLGCLPLRLPSGRLHLLHCSRPLQHIPANRPRAAMIHTATHRDNGTAVFCVRPERREMWPGQPPHFCRRQCHARSSRTGSCHSGGGGGGRGGGTGAGGRRRRHLHAPQRT
eukprot:gene16034-biopygen20238